MSNKVDKAGKDFASRFREAAGHAKLDPKSLQAIGTHLGDVDRRKVAVWLSGSLPRADKLFDIADRFGVDPRWLATGDGEMIAKHAAPQGVTPQEFELVERYRGADVRWRLSLRLLAALAVDDQIEIASDVNVVIARAAGKKTHELRFVGNQVMEDHLKKSPQGFPPTSLKKRMVK